MAVESTLSSARTEVLNRMAFVAGYGATYAGIADANSSALIDSVFKQGLRQAYFPPPLPGQPPFVWPFLRPTAYLTLTAPYNTGTVTIAAGVVTLAVGTWPSTAATAEIIVNGSSYKVSTRDSDSQVTLLDTSVTASAGTHYSMVFRDVALPENFGGMDGDLTYLVQTSWPTVKIITESMMRELRQNECTTIFRPKYAAERPINTSNTTYGQRFELLLHPAPDAAYRMQYRYTVLPDLPTSSNYPLGGAMFADLIEQSCLSALEFRLNDEHGAQHERFMEVLAATIQHFDMRGPEYLGYMGDNSDDRTSRFGRSRTQTEAPYTYNGV